MKKIVLLVLALCLSIDAYAFGGGGGGRSSKRYEYGVSAIGTHVDPDHPIVQPDFRDCNDNETAVIGKCCPNSQVYTDNGVDKCCDANGYVVKNGACVMMTASATLTQNDENYTFTWKQPGYVNGQIVERAAGSWTLYYNAASRSAEVHDFTLDGNGNLKEEVWYPDSLEEIENTPLKGSNTTSWLKDLLGIKQAVAWVMNCSEGSAGYGYMYNSICGGCAGGASVDGRGRCGFNTDEWQAISDMDRCVMEKGSWRLCVCGGTLAKVNGQWVCNCPAGGSPSSGNYACCSADGYTYNSQTQAYDTIEAMYCGCPTGTKLVNDHFCCDSQGYAVWGKNSKELSDVCLNDLCPNGGTLLGDGTCCKNGWAYNEDTERYSTVSVLCPCPAHGVREGPACCRDGKGLSLDGNYTVQYENPNYCALFGGTNWTESNNVFTFNYKVYYLEDESNLMAGSWTLEYDATSNTYKVTDYYRASNGELKTVVWYASSFEEVENTPVKQGEDHAFLNKLKELFGIKSAMATICTRPGTCGNEDWDKFNCVSGGGTWENGECHVKECPQGFHLSKMPSHNVYLCCEEGYEANNELACCGPKGCCRGSGKGGAGFDDFGSCCDLNRMAIGHRGIKVCCEESGELPIPYWRGGTKYSACCSLYNVVGRQAGAGVDGECCSRGVEIVDGNSRCCEQGTYSDVDSDRNIVKCCKIDEMIGPSGECCKRGTTGCCDENEFLWKGECKKGCNEQRPYRYCNKCHECPVETPVRGWKCDKSWWDRLVGNAAYCEWDGTCNACPAHMTYTCEDGVCSCPEGGYLSSKSLAVCCSADGKSLDAEGKYTVDNPQYCGCPEGAEWKKGKPQGVCCQDGWVVDSKGNKTGLFEAVCGCPENVEVSVVRGERVCCKDGKMPDIDTDTGEYVPGGEYVVSPMSARYCGCPDEGKYCRDYTDCCCKDGKMLNNIKEEGRTGKYDIVNQYSVHQCGCPDGGKLALGTTGICCKNGKMLNIYTDSGNTGKYDLVDDTYCKCPDNQTRNETTGECEENCESPMTWDGEKKKCMCPEDVEPTEKNGQKYCCKDNFAYNKSTSRYDGYDPDICDCPEGGTPQGSGCCKNASLWSPYCLSCRADGCRQDGQVYSGYCVPSCGDGCPEGSTPAQNGVDGCCQGAGYNARQVGDAHWHFMGQYPKACGDCVEGMYTTNEAGTEFACCSENGKDIQLGVASLPGETHVIREEVESSLCCKSGIYSTVTGACCAGDGNGKDINGHDDEGCCGGGNGAEWITTYDSNGACCQNGYIWSDNTKQFDKVDRAKCGCPYDTNDPSDDDTVCCSSQGYMYSSEKGQGTVEENTLACGCVCPEPWTCEYECPWGTIETLNGQRYRDCCPYPETYDGERDCCANASYGAGTCGRYYGSRVCCMTAGGDRSWISHGGNTGACCIGMTNTQTNEWDENCCDSKNYLLVDVWTSDKKMCCGYDGKEYPTNETKLECCMTNPTGKNEECCDLWIQETEKTKVGTRDQWNAMAVACCAHSHNGMGSYYTDSQGYRHCCDYHNDSADSPDYAANCCHPDAGAYTVPYGHPSGDGGKKKCCNGVNDKEGQVNSECCGNMGGEAKLVKGSESEYVCCGTGDRTGYKFNDSDIKGIPSEQDFENCGCPIDTDHNMSNTTEYKNGVCCSASGYALENGHYDKIDTKACGCPSGYTPKGDELCCDRDSRSLSNEECEGSGCSELPDYVKCGCPQEYDDNGMMGYQGEYKNGTCCGGGYEYNTNDHRYNIINVAKCDCPNGYEKEGEICCAKNESGRTGKDSSGQDNAACCPSADTSEACCTAKGGTYFTTDSETPYCCNGSTDLAKNEVSQMCCMYQASKGTVGSECCKDGMEGGATSGEQTNWAQELNRQCCDIKGWTWTERQATGETICCQYGVENRPYYPDWPLKCCAANESAQELTWQAYGSGTVCVDTTKVAYAIKICADANKQCCVAKCSPNQHFGETSDGSIAGCCDSPDDFPSEYTDTDGKQQLGCCPLNKYPSPFASVIDGAAHHRCCAAGEHASAFNMDGKSGSWCCPEGQEASYDAVSKKFGCCEAGTYWKQYEDADGIPKTTCCPSQDDVVDNYGTCCSEEERVDALRGNQDMVKECCSPLPECGRPTKYHLEHPCSDNGTCKCGCLTNDDCNQSLKFGEYPETCNADFVCRQPASFMVGDVHVVINDFNRGWITEEMVRSLIAAADFPEQAYGVTLIIGSARTDSDLTHDAGSWLGGVTVQSKITLNALECAPKEENIGRFFFCAISLRHEGVHALDHLNVPSMGGDERMSVGATMKQILTEIAAHREQAERLMKLVFTECQQEQTQECITRTLADTKPESYDFFEDYLTPTYIAKYEAEGNTWVDSLNCDLETKWLNSNNAIDSYGTRISKAAEKNTEMYENFGWLSHFVLNVIDPVMAHDLSVSWDEAMNILIKAYDEYQEFSDTPLCVTKDQIIQSDWVTGVQNGLNTTNAVAFAQANAHVQACALSASSEEDCEDAELQADCENGKPNCVTIDEYLQNLSDSANALEGLEIPN